jgi:thiol-disulfide isomerase/thioredoxin
MKRVQLILSLVLAAWPALTQAALAPFVAGTLGDIEDRHGGNVFIVALWATDCAPCRGELALLSDFSRAHPDVGIILVATDPPDAAAVASEVLSQYELDSAETWIFADGNRERVQYDIDPRWFGELPRAYLYSPGVPRIAISGTLSKPRLDAWLAATRK